MAVLDLEPCVADEVDEVAEVMEFDVEALDGAMVLDLLYLEPVEGEGEMGMYVNDGFGGEEICPAMCSWIFLNAWRRWDLWDFEWLLLLLLG